MVALYAWIALLVLELILQFIWHPWYYRSGFPLFNVRIPAPAAGRSRLAPSGLELDVAWHGTRETVFRRLPDGNIAFRDSYAVISSRYYPVMHGLVVVDAARREIRVMGLSNWNTPVLLLIIGWLATRPAGAPVLLILPILFLGYWIQRRRFLAVVEAVREQLTFDHKLRPALGSVE